MRVFRRFSFLLLCLGFCCAQLPAQRGIGFRFASDINYFFRSKSNELIDGAWSHIVIGPYFSAYYNNGGAQVGFNFIYKNNQDTGFPNFPGVMEDISGDHNIGITALEMDLKVGPRFGVVNPKIGYLVSYWFKREGFLEDGAAVELNNWNVQLPFGATFDFPTGYGSVGFGLFFEVGLTNVIKNPDRNSFQNFNGSRVRAVNAELFILIATGKQERPLPKKLRELEEGSD